MWVFLGVTLTGFFAQLIGGTIGMAFGVTATTGLLLAGYTPALASSVVHFVEIGTSLLNGTFHARAKNIDWPTMLTVGLPGAIGAFVGALLLSSLDLGFTKPWTATVLALLGVYIIVRNSQAELVVRNIRPNAFWAAPMGLSAGFVDATAGGGWGVMTTSTLVASNTMDAGRVVGTTSSARFFVAVAGSLGFLLGLGAHGIPWLAVAAMLLGALVAAPIAARLVKTLPSKTIGLVVGIVVVVINVRQLAVSFGADTNVVLGAMLAAFVLSSLLLVVLLKKR
ncbi:MAG: sulfite exporter TauE/SafE family protein [Microbacteriaceae bacterium]